MQNLRRILIMAAPIAAVAGIIGVYSAQSNAEATAESAEAFPLGTHQLLPGSNWLDLRVAYGGVTDEVLPQPIEGYSHQLHAGTLGIDCQYCHSSARRTIHAGVPATQTCMGCHANIDPTGRPGLIQLKDYYDKGEPIPWLKVHDLPDFVYFSHKRHVTAGVDCAECHGDMKTKTVAERVSTLQMGWCLNCHREHPSVDQNYGAQAETRRAELKDCVTCHK